MKKTFLATTVAVLVLGGSSMTALAHHSSKPTSPSKGSILFGKQFKKGKMVHETNQIPRGKGFAYWAHFAKKIGANKVTIELINTKGPGPHGPGTRPSISTHANVKKSATYHHGYISAGELAANKVKPAGYTLEYFVGSRIVAKGDVTIEKCAQCGGSGGGY